MERISQLTGLAIGQDGLETAKTVAEFIAKALKLISGRAIHTVTFHPAPATDGDAADGGVAAPQGNPIHDPGARAPVPTGGPQT